MCPDINLINTAVEKPTNDNDSKLEGDSSAEQVTISQFKELLSNLGPYTMNLNAKLKVADLIPFYDMSLLTYIYKTHTQRIANSHITKSEIDRIVDHIADGVLAASNALANIPFEKVKDNAVYIASAMEKYADYFMLECNSRVIATFFIEMVKRCWATHREEYPHLQRKRQLAALMYHLLVLVYIYKHLAKSQDALSDLIKLDVILVRILGENYLIELAKSIDHVKDMLSLLPTLIRFAQNHAHEVEEQIRGVINRYKITISEANVEAIIEASIHMMNFLHTEQVLDMAKQIHKLREKLAEVVRVICESRSLAGLIASVARQHASYVNMSISLKSVTNKIKSTIWRTDHQSDKFDRDLMNMHRQIFANTNQNYEVNFEDYLHVLIVTNLHVNSQQN